MRRRHLIPLAAALALASVDAHARVRCATPEHRVRLRHVAFSNADRPTKPQVVRATSGRVSVHYDPAEVTAARARLALDLAEAALQVEVDQMGWPAPVPDRDFGGDAGLDLYFDNLGTDVAYTAPDGEDPALAWDAAMAYIVLDSGIGADALPSFIYHEVNHALQFATDVGEADSLWEATASYMEYFTQPEAVVDTGYLPSFQGDPGSAVDDFNHRDEYEYGYALFLFFVSQRYFGGGPEIVRDLWTGSRQLSTGSTYVNEPDYVDVLVERLAPTTLPDALAEFSRWRSFVGAFDDGQHVRLPGVLPTGSEMATAGRVSASALPHSVSLSVAETGSAFVLVDVDVDGRGVLAEVSGGATDDLLEVSVLATAADNTVRSTVTARGDAPAAVVDATGATAVRVLVARLGDGDHDPDRKEWSRGAYSVTVSLVDPPAPDAGPVAGGGGDAPPPRSSCGSGCASADGAGLVGLLALLGRRRRRPTGW